MKDWTGQEYDEQDLADPKGGRAQYDENLIRQINPVVSLNISGPVGGGRSAPRCRTGYVLSADATCEKCGAARNEPCRSDLPGTAGLTAGNEISRAPTIDPDVQTIIDMLKARRK